MVVCLSLLVLPDAVLADAFPEGVPMGRKEAALRMAGMLASEGAL